jgi:photosystem II stability/assembly factor-like uncharacterized protein
VTLITAVAATTAPAFGGRLVSLAVDPRNHEIVYAGGWGNVFKSTNGGGTWKDVTTQPWTRVTALAIDPTAGWGRSR